MKVFITTSILVLTLLACGDDADDRPSSFRRIRAEVSRTAAIADGQDGIGVLYVAALSACDFSSDLLGATGVPDADLSAVDGRVPFGIDMLPPQIVQLALFLDDDQSADPAAPAVGPGDLVHAPSGVGDGNLDCVAVDLRVGDIEGISILLDGTVPGG